MQTGPTIDELTIRELVALRLMLEDALNRARSAGRYSRGAAVVALDATVERATYLVAQSRGLNPGPRATLPDVYSSLKQDLAGTWEPRTWPLINKLHMERNKVQHQGLEPDRDQLPTWIQAVESYVVSLVQAEYSADIRHVLLADAIDDPELGDHLRQAEETLEAGDVAAGVAASLAAFDTAVARWTEMVATPYRPPRATYVPDIGTIRGSDHQDRAIESLHRAAAESSFAASAAEHDWFRAVRREPVEVLDADDAERILSFVFSWIASFEVAAREWAPDRRYRADVAARRQRTQPGSARVDEVSSVERRGDAYKVVFELIDLPPESEFERWSGVLGSILAHARAENEAWWVRPDGTVTLNTYDGAKPRAGHLNGLDDALRQVEQTIEQQDLEAAKRREVLDAERAQMQAELDSVRDRLPDWIESISWLSAGPIDHKPSWTFSVRRVESLPTTARTGPIRSLTWDVADILRASERVIQCYTSEANVIIEPAIGVEDLVAVLDSVNETVAAYIGRLDEQDEQHMAAIAEVRAELARALAIRRGPT